MCEQLHEQKKKQAQQTTRREKELDAHFSRLENWRTGSIGSGEIMKGRFEERTRSIQTQQNEQLAVLMGRQAPAAAVQAAAPVEQPPVQQIPAQESRKARRERLSKREKAQELNPQGDESTYDMAHEIHEVNESKSYFLNGKDEQRAIHLNPPADMRMLKIFGFGYRTNFLHRPVSREDRAAYEQDRRYVEDYLSGDKERRRPHLQRIVGEMLNVRFTPDMLSDAFIKGNAGSLKDLGDKITYFENLQKENPEFFQNLPEVQKDLLKNVSPVWFAYTNAITQRFNSLGVNYNKGEMYNARTKDIADNVISLGNEMSAPLTQQYQDSLRTFGADSTVTLQKEYDRRLRQFTEEAHDSNQDTINRNKEHPNGVDFGIQFSSEVTYYQYDEVTKIRQLIGTSPHYARNRETVDRLYTEYFRNMELYGNLSLRGLAVQGGVDAGGPMANSNLVEGALQRRFSAAQDTLLHRQDTLYQRLGSLSDALHGLLEDSELSPSAELVLQEFMKHQGGEAPGTRT